MWIEIISFLELSKSVLVEARESLVDRNYALGAYEAYKIVEARESLVDRN